MTDQQLRDQAVAELELTTVGFKNTHWTVPPSGTHWKNALDLLAQIGGTPPPPPPPPGGVALPVGPFKKSGSVSYNSATKPVEVAGLDIENLTGPVNGLTIMQWPPVLSSGRYNVHDVITQNIGNQPPTSNGTAEAGIWIGQSADVNRVVCDATWEGLWTGAMCADSVIQNFTIGKADGKGGFTGQSSKNGLYCEHFTRRTLFKNFEINAADFGIISEWWYADATYAPFVAKEFPGAMAGKAGSCHNTYDTGKIYCPAGSKGIFFDAGTWGNTVKNITFWGPGDAIWAPNHLAGPDANVIDASSCTFNQGGKDVTFHNNGIG